MVEVLTYFKVLLSTTTTYIKYIAWQGSRESSKGPGQIYVVTALIKYLSVLLEYIDLFGAHKQSGAQGKMPRLPPPLGGPVAWYLSISTSTMVTFKRYSSTSTDVPGPMPASNPHKNASLIKMS